MNNKIPLMHTIPNEPVDDIEKFMKMKNGFCPNSKDYFKYIIPKKVYDLFSVAWIHQNRDIEFYTLNPDYKEIWSYFRQSDKCSRCELNSMEYDRNYHCYVVDIMAMDFLNIICKDFYDPYRYKGHDIYVKNAQKLGYTDLNEINEDFKRYHTMIGDKFQEIGLL